MHEIVINLHIHTPYSDGYGSHINIAKAAIKAGLDAVIITDHNVWVDGIEGYYEEEGKQVLILIGEEIHDQTRYPQRNHLLVIGTGSEMAHLAQNSQTLIDRVIEANGLAFLAHPIEFDAPKFNEGDLSWVNWDIHNFTGIELWNAMTEFKSLVKGYPEAIFYAFNFNQVAHGPFPETLQKWDELLELGSPVVAVGGSDAHEFRRSLGPIKKKLFPYYQHFKAINTHLLIPEPFSGDIFKDKPLILDALRDGHAFIGNDLPFSTRGFRFLAHFAEGEAIMGDTIKTKGSKTLQIKLPQSSECRLLRNGEVIHTSRKRGTIIHRVKEPGIYRAEAYIFYKGKRRGWIFSNPIYVI
jgi:hypothetical protein